MFVQAYINILFDKNYKKMPLYISEHVNSSEYLRNVPSHTHYRRVDFPVLQSVCILQNTRMRKQIERSFSNISGFCFKYASAYVYAFPSAYVYAFPRAHFPF